MDPKVYYNQIKEPLNNIKFIPQTKPKVEIVKPEIQQTNNYGPQQSLNNLGANFENIISFETQPEKQNSLFGDSQFNLGGNFTNQSENQNSLFGDNLPNQTEKQNAFFGGNLLNQPEKQNTLFGDNFINQPPEKQNALFGENLPNQPEKSNSLFGDKFLNQPEKQNALLGENLPEQQNALFGDNFLNQPEKQNALFGDNFLNQPEQQNALFGDNLPNQPEIQNATLGLFGKSSDSIENQNVSAAITNNHIPNENEKLVNSHTPVFSAITSSAAIQDKFELNNNQQSQSISQFGLFQNNVNKLQSLSSEEKITINKNFTLNDIIKGIKASQFQEVLIKGNISDQSITEDLDRKLNQFGANITYQTIQEDLDGGKKIDLVIGFDLNKEEIKSPSSGLPVLLIGQKNMLSLQSDSNIVYMNGNLKDEISLLNQKLSDETKSASSLIESQSPLKQFLLSKSDSTINTGIGLSLFGKPQGTDFQQPIKTQNNENQLPNQKLADQDQGGNLFMNNVNKIPNLNSASNSLNNSLFSGIIQNKSFNTTTTPTVPEISTINSEQVDLNQSQLVNLNDNDTFQVSSSASSVSSIKGFAQTFSSPQIVTPQNLDELSQSAIHTNQTQLPEISNFEKKDQQNNVQKQQEQDSKEITLFGNNSTINFQQNQEEKQNLFLTSNQTVSTPFSGFGDLNKNAQLPLINNQQKDDQSILKSNSETLFSQNQIPNETSFGSSFGKFGGDQSSIFSMSSQSSNYSKLGVFSNLGTPTAGLNSGESIFGINNQSDSVKETSVLTQKDALPEINGIKQPTSLPFFQLSKDNSIFNKFDSKNTNQDSKPLFDSTKSQENNLLSKLTGTSTQANTSIFSSIPTPGASFLTKSNLDNTSSFNPLQTSITQNSPSINFGIAGNNMSGQSLFGNSISPNTNINGGGLFGSSTNVIRTGGLFQN